MREEAGLADERGLLPGDLVTGEAVVLDLRSASFATRMLGAALDVVIQVALLVALFWAVAGAGTGLDDSAAAALGLVVVVAVLVGYPTAWETATRGRSPGKLAAGLRVVRDDGGPVRFRHALPRALVGFGELWLLLGSPAVITSLASPRGKRLGDLLAGTYVVRERAPRQWPAPVEMPPPLTAWAASADIGRLPDDTAMAVRQLHARAAAMHPGARAELAAELAGQVAPLVAPAPPPGTPPEAFLAAVTAERRRRDAVRLLRERASRQERDRTLGALPFGLDDPT